MPAAPPRFLFVPVSGPGGAGEYYRSLAIARGLERRWPHARIRFALNREAAYAHDAPYEGLSLDDSPTRSSPQVVEYIHAERPDVVIFDSSGRLAQYRAARDAGAGVVYVSSRPKTRWKGFRWRRMRALDQHWLAQPRFLGGAPTPYERLKLQLVGRPEIVILEVMHEPVDEPAVRALQSRLGLEPGRYVAMCPGGGGDFGHAVDANRVFDAAAEAIAASQPRPVVLVLAGAGRHELQAAPSSAGVRIIELLPNGQLIGLLRDAAVVAVNGGSLLLQCMAQGLPTVAAPIAGDQAARIRGCAREGYVQETSLGSEAMTAAVSTLLRDDAARSRLRHRLAELGLRNGVDVATEAVGRLLQTRRRARPSQ
jgi:spore coat polysaccharide biosynthesis predicted glycosyltransferase SpsG